MAYRVPEGCTSRYRGLKFSSDFKISAALWFLRSKCAIRAEAKEIIFLQIRPRTKHRPPNICTCYDLEIASAGDSGQASVETAKCFLCTCQTRKWIRFGYHKSPSCSFPAIKLLQMNSWVNRRFLSKYWWLQLESSISLRPTCHGTRGTSHQSHPLVLEGLVLAWHANLLAQGESTFRVHCPVLLFGNLQLLPASFLLKLWTICELRKGKIHQQML